MRSSAAVTTELLSLALTLNLPSCHVFLSALLSYSLFKGGSPKRRQKERGCINSVHDKGGEGVKKSEHFADVIYGSPLCGIPILNHVPVCHLFLSSQKMFSYFFSPPFQVLGRAENSEDLSRHAMDASARADAYGAWSYFANLASGHDWVTKP